jgi:glutaredoxin
VVYDIEKDGDAAKRKERLSPGKGVPFAVINGKKIYGFSEEIYSQALGPK